MSKSLIVKSLIAALLLAACSAKVSSDGGVTIPTGPNLDDPAPKDFQHEVAGPDLSGHWVSRCTPSIYGGTEIIDMKINRQHIVRAAHRFTDQNCQQAGKTQTESGQFRYTTESNGLYRMDYRFKMVNGWYLQNENIRFDHGSFRISNEIGGDAEANVDMTGQSNEPSQPSL